MREVVIPVGDAKIIYDTGLQRKFIVDCVPMSSVRSANRDLFVTNMEHKDFVEYISPSGRLVISGYNMNKLQHLMQHLYVHIPAMHHIVWSDLHLFDVPVPTNYGMRDRVVESKAFVSVSDCVNVGISYRDSFYGNRGFIIKRVTKNSWDSILTAAGLPNPIPQRKKKFIITEKCYKRLVEIYNYVIKRRNKRAEIWLKEKMDEAYDLTDEWFHDIISTEIGTYDWKKYTINWRAVGTHPDIKVKLSRMLWYEAKEINMYACRDNKNFKGKMSVDLNRILIKK